MLYGLLKHVHLPEIVKTIERLSGESAAGLVFTPHLVPMTRGILTTNDCRGLATTARCMVLMHSAPEVVTALLVEWCRIVIRPQRLAEGRPGPTQDTVARSRSPHE